MIVYVSYSVMIISLISEMTQSIVLFKVLRDYVYVS